MEMNHCCLSPQWELRFAGGVCGSRTKANPWLCQHVQEKSQLEKKPSQPLPRRVGTTSSGFWGHVSKSRLRFAPLCILPGQRRCIDAQGRPRKAARVGVPVHVLCPVLRADLGLGTQRTSTSPSRAHWIGLVVVPRWSWAEQPRIPCRGDRQGQVGPGGTEMLQPLLLVLNMQKWSWAG